ncbi:MAG: tetratricopeptide repeat protein [Candidatus Eisenbacteria bacterium]
MARGKKAEVRKKGGGKPRVIGRGTAAAILLLLVLAGWGVRVLFLDADPPFSISWSQGPFTDGAVVVHDARSKALFGEWITDYTKDVYLFPLSNIAAYAVFLAAGVNRAAAAWPNTLFAALSIAALSLGLWNSLGPRRAILWAYLASFNYFLVMFQRIPIAEPAMIFLLSLSFLFFTLGGRWRWAPLLAGFFAVGAPLFGKAHAYYFPVALGLTYLLTRRGEEGEGARIRLALAGMAAAAALWLAVLFLPEGGHIFRHLAHESYGKHTGGPAGAAVELLQNLLGMGTYTKLFERMPVLATLGFLGFAGLLAKGRRLFREEEPAAVLLFLWFTAGWLAIAAVRLPAPRYLSALVFPLLYLATRPLSALAEGKTLTWKMPRSRAGSLVAAALFLFAFYQPLSTFGTPMLSRLKLSGWGSGIYALFVRDEAYRELVFFCLVLAAILMLAALGLIALRGGEKPFRVTPSRGGGLGLAALLLGLSVFVNMGNWYYWAATRTHYLRDGSRDLADWMGPGARLMGSYAPTLGLDNRLRVFPYLGDIGETDVFRKYGITHVAVVSKGDHTEVKENYPEIFESWKMVLSYPIKCKYSDTMGIFRLPAETEGARINDYEPGLFEQGVDLATERRWEEALDRLSRFTVEKPGNADGHYLVGFMYNEIGRPEEAIRSIEHAIGIRPERAYYYFKLGEIYADLGRNAESRRLLEISNRLNPRDSEVRDALDRMGPGAR